MMSGFTPVRHCCIALALGAVLSCAAAPVQSVYPGDLPMWRHINSVPPLALRNVPHGAILPHHTMTARETARVYKGLAEKISPETVFILSPDHYESGGGDVLVADDLSFETVYGRLDTDRVLAGKLSAETGAVIRSGAFGKEHGVYFHAPFIKKYFPGARIVPVLLPWQNAYESNNAIASFIAQHSGAGTFVIASVDCSHFQPRDVADFHDESTYDAVINFRMDKLYHCEIDSPPSAYVCMKVMDLLGSRSAERLLHTNSDDFVKRKEISTTSHQYYVFYKGEPAADDRLAVLVSGSIGADNRNLFVQQYWDWNRAVKPEDETGARNFLLHLRGTEDRFLSGADLYLFDCREADTAEMFTAAGQRVAVIQFNDLPAERQRQTDDIRRLKKSGQRVLVVFCYGSGLADAHRVLFRSWIDAGADAVIGRGIPAADVEYRGSGIILYSPGPFISGRSDEGFLYGLVFSRKGVRMYRFPLTMQDGFTIYKKLNY